MHVFIVLARVYSLFCMAVDPSIPTMLGQSTSGFSDQADIARGVVIGEDKGKIVQGC